MHKLICATKCSNNHMYPQIHSQDSLHFTIILVVLRGAALPHLSRGTRKLAPTLTSSDGSRRIKRSHPTPILWAPSRPTSRPRAPSRPTSRPRAPSHRPLGCGDHWGLASIYLSSSSSMAICLFFLTSARSKQSRSSLSLHC